MKIPFTKYKLSFVKIPEPEKPLDRFDRLAEEMTVCWQDNYRERDNVIPWIDWTNKEVFIAERGAVKRKGDS